MPRPKKPQTSNDGPVIDHGEVQKVNDASRAMVAIDGAAAEQARRHLDLAQVVGAFAAVGYIQSQFSSLHVRMFNQIRDQKLYVGYPYQDESGALQATATLEDFCAHVLHVSYETMRERSKQHELAGGDAGFDGAMRLGLTFKQFRALEGADTEKRKKIAAALEKGTRTEVLDLFDEVIEERREKAQEAAELAKQIEAKDRVIDQKNKKLDQLAEESHKVPPWQRTWDKAMKTTSELVGALQVACANFARHAEAIHELEFEGAEKRDTLALRAQVANHFYDLSEHLLEQSVGLFVAARGEHIEPLLELARKQLPEDVKAKIFGGEK